jgi:hypothetical protein
MKTYRAMEIRIHKFLILESEEGGWISSQCPNAVALFPGGKKYPLFFG